MKWIKKSSYYVGSTFRFHSIFFRTFLVVLILILLFLGGVVFYTLQTENKSLQENAENSYLNLLETTGTATELTLQNLQLMMNQTIWRKEFTNAIIIPTEENYTRTSAIITQLRFLADNYPFIDKAFLYIPTDKTVYSSDLSYLPGEQSSDRIFQDPDLLTSFSGSRISSSESSLCIQKAGERVLLCQHLYPDYLPSIGVLIFEINLSALELSLSQGDVDVTDVFYVFDEEKPVFSQRVPEHVSAQASRLRQGSQSSNKGVVEEDGFLYFYYQSSATNWLYLYPASAQSFHFQPSAERILFVGIVVILLGFFFALQVAFRANRPIRSLLAELSKAHPDAVDAKNEVDYLTKVYNYTTVQNSHLHQAIQSVTPLALERLFSDILNGRAPTAESIEATLDSLGHPFLPGTRFMAVHVEVSNRLGTEISVLEMNLHILQLRVQLNQTLPEEYRSCLVPRENPFATIILAVPPEIREAELRQTVPMLCKKLEGLAQTTPYQIETGCGNLYSHMKDVRYSYLEAQKNLNHKRFYGDRQAEGAPENLPSQNPYFEKTKQIFTYIQGNQAADAVSLAEELVHEIREENEDALEVRQQYLILIDTITEIAESWHIGTMEELLPRRLALQSRLRDGGEIGRLEVETGTFCRDAISSIEHRNRKKASQHINRIQGYIHANYSNNSLSLDMAAEQVGISPSYLSRLFKQEIGVSFVDYINNYRVERSKQLLESSELLVKDIAFQTGFNSMQNFFRIFKKHTGVSPGEYRQSYQQKQKD